MPHSLRKYWKYNREDLNTWLELCPKCHQKYDKNYDFRRKLLNDLGIKLHEIPTS